ncbi:uncharacterized protein CTHT_0049690 [Thermochaetoides thermophila DSM 1495]|uniref:NACHT domain-containing protein n=1 Tax=Chaetomium thermophilum (strain DSM 1495 / CBS 144.50 / IMI 039719) TaxID=759272 RepID=G0SBC1_CHATD|nr:hypothetical protein CTHT_0049690 [Thermochaetoides thermophila DSM 1495]EGS19501.1 hypothetical protein CTHT_0049690 [Thermochaetoides thermophila DSM 1495]
MDAYNRHGKKHRSQPSLSDVEDMFHAVTALYKDGVFVIVDALDECQMSNNVRSKFIKTLLQLQSRGTNVNLLATSRPEPDIMEAFSGYSYLEIIAQKDDIERYIRNRMSDWHVVSNYPDLRDEVVSCIISVADGMFLLARLFLESLKSKVSARRIRETMKKLRKSSQEKNPKLALLRQAYDSVMERINGQPSDYKELANHVLSWIVCAKRPVKTIEVQYAWAVRDCEGRIEEAAVPDVEDMLLACCELVVVDKESDIIRLVHCTAQEYFQDTLTRWFPDGHSNIANTCVSYLSFNDFSGGPVKTREEAYERLEKPLFSYAVDHWGHHISACPSSTFRLIDRLKDPEWSVSMGSMISSSYFLCMPRILIQTDKTRQAERR